MKKLLYFFILSFIVACSHPSIEKDGGTRLVLEASVSDLLRKHMVNDDSLANAVIYETYKAYPSSDQSFIDLYFSKLEKAGAGIPAGKHFQVEGLSATANAADCKVFFEKELSKGMDALIAIISMRIDKLGVYGSVVSKEKKQERLLVEVPGKVDAQRLRKLLQSAAELEFWETVENKDVYESFVKLDKALAAEQIPEAEDSLISEEVKVKEGASLDEQFAAQKSDGEKQEEERNSIMAENPFFSLLSPAIDDDNRGQYKVLKKGPMVGTARISDTAKINSMLHSEKAKAIFGRYIKFLWNFKPYDAEQKYIQLVAIKVPRTGKAPLSGNIIIAAEKVFNDSDGGGQISITMTKEAGWEWKEMTAKNIGNAIAIVVDNRVYSYPIVNSEIRGGMSCISGNFTNQELDDLANMMKTGYLPLSLRIVQEDIIAPIGK